jgi:hypothetical protein
MTLLLPRFPLSSPTCRFCNCNPRYRSSVMPNNPNGNAYRPFYSCIRCRPQRLRTRSDHERGWITWDDGRGIAHSNPNCDCGVPSWQHRAGVESPRHGLGFWTCASGSCGYSSEYLNAETREEARDYHMVPNRVTFRPWLC